MLQSITITNEDILTQVNLSCKLPEIIEGIVTSKVIENALIEADIQIETEELQQAADKFRLMHKLESAEDTWAWLKKHGLSLENFEEIIYNKVASEKLATHLFADKIEPYFFGNQLNYTFAVMYEVILDDEDLALELFYAIKEGETSFYDVAHKYIQNIELRRQGGYRGVVSRRSLKPEISSAVFAAKPPQLLKPIVTSSGIHLIFVEEIIQPQLDKSLRSELLADFFREWLKNQVEQLEITQKL